MKTKLGLLLVSLMCCSGCGGSNTSSSNPTQSNNSASSSINISLSSSSVKEEDLIAVYGLESKNSFINYAQYKGEQTNKEDEFMDREQTYKVGDENGFSFKPQLTLAVLPAGSTNLDDVEFRYNADWSYNIKLFMLNDNNEYVDASLDEYVESLDNENCLIDFTDAAIGHSFKISLYPEGLNEAQLENVETEWTQEYEFDVVEGYNVTSAKELAYIQNDTTDMKKIGSLPTINYKTIWDAFKEANGLDVNYLPSALILHDDINITKDDIPSEYFYSEEETLSFFPNTENPNYKKVLGSLKDWMHIYYRDFAKDSELYIEGNYFSINASQLPIVVKDNDSNEVPEYLLSHTALFRFQGEETGKSAIKNAKLIGNAPRKDDASLSGGAIFIKVEGPEYTSYNNIANRWFITYFPNKSVSPFLMDKCRAYNNFNSFIYNWGAKNVTIRNCEFKRTGGPVIIQDCLYDDDTDNTNDIPGEVKIEDSVLESIVAGSEGWFKIMTGAEGKAQEVKALDFFFKPNKKSIIQMKNDIEYINLISVNKSHEIFEIASNFNTKGSITITDSDTDYSFDYGATNPFFQAYYTALISHPQLKDAPIFESSAGGMAFTDSKNGILTLNGTTPVPVGANDNIFKGDYLAIYNGGMQFVIDYYDYTPAQ